MTRSKSYMVTDTNATLQSTTYSQVQSIEEIENGTASDSTRSSLSNRKDQAEMFNVFKAPVKKLCWAWIPLLLAGIAALIYLALVFGISNSPIYAHYDSASSIGKQGSLQVYPIKPKHDMASNILNDVTIGADIYSHYIRLKQVVQQYPLSINKDEYTDCTLNQSQPSEYKPCFFDRTWLGENCTEENRFGYFLDKNGKINPCFLVKINTTENWIPKNLDSNEMESNLLNEFDEDYLKFECEASITHMKKGKKCSGHKISRFPTKGFNLKYFQNTQRNKMYLSPAVMVQVFGIEPGENVTVICSVKFSNVNELVDNGQARINFNFPNEIFDINKAIQSEKEIKSYFDKLLQNNASDSGEVENSVEEIDLLNNGTERYLFSEYESVNLTLNVTTYNPDLITNDFTTAMINTSENQLNFTNLPKTLNMNDSDAEQIENNTNIGYFTYNPNTMNTSFETEIPQELANATTATIDWNPENITSETIHQTNWISNSFEPENDTNVTDIITTWNTNFENEILKELVNASTTDWNSDNVTTANINVTNWMTLEPAKHTNTTFESENLTNAEPENLTNAEPGNLTLFFESKNVTNTTFELGNFINTIVEPVNFTNTTIEPENLTNTTFDSEKLTTLDLEKLTNTSTVEPANLTSTIESENLTSTIESENLTNSGPTVERLEPGNLTNTSIIESENLTNTIEPITYIPTTMNGTEIEIFHELLNASNTGWKSDNITSETQNLKNGIEQENVTNSTEHRFLNSSIPTTTNSDFETNILKELLNASLEDRNVESNTSETITPLANETTDGQIIHISTLKNILNMTDEYTETANVTETSTLFSKNYKTLSNVHDRNNSNITEIEVVAEPEMHWDSA